MINYDSGIEVLSELLLDFREVEVVRDLDLIPRSRFAPAIIETRLIISRVIISDPITRS